MVIDIENVIGGAAVDPRAVLWAQRQVASLLAPTATDLVVIGTSHVGLLTVGIEWPSVRYVVASGPDGADLALLDVLDERVASRFDEVALVSGDGIFTESVATLTAEGVRVAVVAHPDGLSKRLTLAANRILLFAERWDATGAGTSGAA